MEEIWKDIKGFEGYYQVSNLGRIKSLKRTVLRGNSIYPVKEKILTPRLRYGYNYINLSKKGADRLGFYVHRLVAQAFIANPDNLSEVNHKDENKLNNCANNLEWCTHKYNCNYGTINIRKRKASKNNTNCLGRIWINNNIISKMIYLEQLEEYIQQGYLLGRIKKGDR